MLIQGNWCWLDLSVNTTEFIGQFFFSLLNPQLMMRQNSKPQVAGCLNQSVFCISNPEAHMVLSVNKPVKCLFQCLLFFYCFRRVYLAAIYVNIVHVVKTVA